MQSIEDDLKAEKTPSDDPQWRALDGLRDRVAPGGAEITYAARELIGISDEQLDQVTDLALSFLTQDL